MKIIANEKQWTILGLTSLKGDPLMCVLISTGKREQHIMETRMDMFAEQVGKVSDGNFFN